MPGPEPKAGFGLDSVRMVETVGITKTFHDAKRGDVRACEDVTLRALPGEIFVLLGVNGAGKTTLLRILSTVLEATSGTASVNGHDVATAPERVRASIGFLSGTTALYGRLTAREALEYFGRLYGLDGEQLRARLSYAFERLDLHDFADRLCDKLSTGQKQRVSIARTILHDPPVLFFDEPTSGLDVVTSQAIMEFVEEARAAGKTVIYCSHIMSEADRLADRIAIIHEGRICYAGSPQDLKNGAATHDMERAFLHAIGYGSNAERVNT